MELHTGLKNTKIPLTSRIILFSFALVVGILSVYFGSFLKNFLSDFTAKVLSCSLLVILGISIFITALKNINHKNCTYDSNNDNIIDSKEALFLAFAVSVDIACVGISGGMMGITNLLFPLLIATFHLLFITFGIYVGNKINSLIKIPNCIWTFISSGLMILIGLSKLVL